MVQTQALQVVSYSISTSNHNHVAQALDKSDSCVLFYFYIKPQLIVIALVAASVVSYSISTSNHNIAKML